MVDLSIIVVSFNTKVLTLEAISSVFQQTVGVSFEVIVVDNASSDGSSEEIAKKFPQVNLISLNENIGFGAANNLAAKSASGEILLLLNPDTVVLDGAIQKLFSFSKNTPHALIWGGRTVFSDGTLNPASCWRHVTLWEIFCRSFCLTWLFPNSAVFNTGGYGGWDRSTIRNVDIVSGCFFMISIEFWKTLGGFSPLFFMYAEEADLCMRASKLGARPMVTPDATIIHYGGASETVRSDKMVRILNAKRLLIRNHWPSWKYKLGMIIYPIYPLSRLLPLAISDLFTNGSNPTAKIWREVWSRRKEWL